MKLPRRSKKQPARQRRPEPESKLSSFAYRARRTDEAVATGRQPDRDTARPVKAAAQSGLRRFGQIVLLLVIVAAAINVLTLSTAAKVLPLTSGDDRSFLHEPAVYETAADKLLSDSIWSHNKLTINTGAVSRQLKQQFPELSEASVTIPLVAHRPIIYIQTNPPALILATSHGSYVVDSSGKALLLSSQLPSTTQLQLPLVADQSGLAVTLNQRALSSHTVSFIQTVLAQLHAQHLAAASITLPPQASELDVQITGQPYFVKFNLQRETALQQVGTYLAMVSQLQGQGVTPAHYIDVRVDGRAYYQ